jgi:hypothetical protein
MMKALGIRAHISKMMTRESTSLENVSMMKVLLAHGLYNASMEAATMYGWGDLSAGAKMSVTDTKAVLGFNFIKNTLKLTGSFPVIAKIYQNLPGSVFEIIYPKCKEGNHLMDQLKKNPAAYIVYSLKRIIPDEFVLNVVAAIFDTSYVQKIHDCKWDSETETITKPSAIADRERADIKDAPWWQDAFDLTEMKKANNKMGNRNPESIFDLEKERLIKTIHNRHKKKAAVSFLGDDSEEDASAASSSIILLSSKNIHQSNGQDPLS